MVVGVSPYHCSLGEADISGKPRKMLVHDRAVEGIGDLW